MCDYLTTKIKCKNLLMIIHFVNNNLHVCAEPIDRQIDKKGNNQKKKGIEPKKDHKISTKMSFLQL